MAGSVYQCFNLREMPESMDTILDFYAMDKHGSSVGVNLSQQGQDVELP